jgi:signal peptidase
MVTTKGVANKMSDAPTRYENVLGVVRFHVPYVGYPLLWLGTTQGKIVSIAALAAILLILLLARLFSRNRKAGGGHKSLPA